MGCNITMLIADDEQEIRSGLRRLINWEKEGICVIGTAQDGEECLQMILNHLPDIVITDINMPQMSGLELIRQARENGFAGRFIVLSGYDDFKYAQMAIRYGVEEYLTKPVSLEELLDCVIRIKGLIIQNRESRHSKAELVYQYHCTSKILEQQNFISEFIRGDLDGNYLRSAMKKINPEFIDAPACAAVVWFYRKDLAGEDNENAVNLNMACNIIRKELQGLNFCMGYGNNSGAVILFHTKEKAVVMKQMEVAATKLLEKHCIHSFTGFGELVEDFSKINISLKTAQKVSSWHIFKQLGFVADDHLLQLYGNYAPVDFQQVIKSVKRGDMQSVRSDFKKYTEQLFAGQPLAVPAYLLSMYHLLITEVRMAVQDKIAFVTGDAYQAMRQFDTFEEIFTWVENLLVDYAGEISLKSIEQNDPVIDKALEYIKEHIFCKVTADDVCKYVGFSKTYFSKYFKEKTSLNFRDYLLNLKIDYAQQKLSEHSCTPGELASLLGYEEYSSFSRAFKMRTGFSPQDYQKIN